MIDAPPGIKALRYHRGSSAALPVTIILTGAGLSIDGGTPYPVTEIKIAEPVGAGTWHVELPDGGMIEIEGSGGRALALELGRRPSSIQRWERSLVLALAAIPLILLALWGFIDLGVPVLADQAVKLVPPSADTLVGDHSYILLKRMADVSKVPLERRHRLRQDFANMSAEIVGDAQRTRLEFLNAPDIGPNAFALPGGTVVATDQLLAILSDDEVEAVLAHELGHVAKRHVMRMALRSAGLAALAGIMVGDVGTVGNVLAGLPVVVMQLDFSRAFENQADDVAFAWLNHPGRSPCTFAKALDRIVAATGAVAAGSVPSWLSTHPGTPERTARFRAYCPIAKSISL